MTSSITFSKPLADSRDYPEPVFPALPWVHGSSSPRTRQYPTAVGATLLTTHARYGLALIAKAELHQGDLVLLPAYHCRALVEPFLWAGCRIRFYTMLGRFGRL